MSLRASLPTDAVTVSPGYPWRLDLDVLFDGERPTDWPQWIVRMHVWGAGVEFKLTPGDGVRFEEVTELEAGETVAVIPVLEMSSSLTERLRDKGIVHYVIDIQPPDGVVEDYFAGSLKLVFTPPAGLLP